MPYFINPFMYLSTVVHFVLIYKYIFGFNSFHQLPHGHDIDLWIHLVMPSCSAYHPMMDLLWRTNESSFNGCVNISAGWLDDSIGRMDILYLAIYARKWWYFILACFVLGIMARSRANVSAPLVSSNSQHRTVGEIVLTLYPRDFIPFRISVIGIVLSSSWLTSMYSL